MEFLGRVAYEAQLMQPLLPTYAHLVASAIFPIYIASHASLNRPNSASKPPKKHGDEEEENDTETEHKIESLNPSDALLFPLLAGCTLASLYFTLKWLQDPAWLNYLLGLYFSWVGLFFAFNFLKDFLTVILSVAFPTNYSSDGQLWTARDRYYKSENGLKRGAPFPSVLRHLPFPAPLERLIWSFRRAICAKAQLNIHIRYVITLMAPVTLLHLTSLLAATSIVYIHAFVAKPWYLTNFLGFSFCYGALQFITPTTGWTGTLVLAALFFYDIYFVFFTPMMVTVATKLDVPIKLLFPKSGSCVLPVGAAEGSIEMKQYLDCVAETETMAMLGLGDIVVPGMLIAFALRFDLYLHYLKMQGKSKGKKEAPKPEYLPATGGWGERLWTSAKLQSDKLRAKTFKKTYFYATVIGYIAGMVATVVVMQVAKHAQPALLYLVPGVVGVFWGTALVKGQLTTLWNYTEAPAEDKENKKDKKDQKSRSNGDGEDARESNTDRHADKSPKPKAASKKSKAIPDHDPEDWSRKLIEFAITLPEKATKKKLDAAEDNDDQGSPKDTQKTIKGRDEVQDDDDDDDDVEGAQSSSPKWPRSRYNLRQSSLGVQVEQDGSEEQEPAVKRRRKV